MAMLTNSTPFTEAILEEVIRRITVVAQPEKITLFGSAARGEMRPDSDLDLLVVKDTPHRRKLAQKIYQNLIDLSQAVDIVMVTPADMVRYADSPALIIRAALREGKVIYDS